MKLNNLVLHIRTIFIGFSHCDGRLREFGLCVPHIYNPVEQEVMAGQFHVHNHPGVLKKKNMKRNIFQRYFIHKNFLGSLTLPNSHNVWLMPNCINMSYFLIAV